MNKQNVLDALEPILRDPDVTEVMIDGYDHVYIEKQGQLQDVPSPFQSREHLIEVIDALLDSLGLSRDASRPIIDVQPSLFNDGTRMNIVMPPIAPHGPTLVLRKFLTNRITAQMLIEFQSATAEILKFIEYCVVGRLNILVSGGTGSGKTTLTNIIASMIPDEERIITVEDSMNLRLDKPRMARLEARPPDLEGKGAVTMQHLVQNVVKMRPDRIIVSEAQGVEVFDLMQALNRGHDGSIVNMHATSPRDALSRLEIMSLTANPSLPLLAIREQIATALDLIVQQERLRDGTRRIVRITEVTGMHGDQIGMQDLFEFVQTGFEDGKVIGKFYATGIIPSFIRRLQDQGIKLPLSLFEPMR